MVAALITGVAGTRLEPDERAFLRDALPWGLILFARNIADPAQVRALIADFRDVVGGDDAPVLIDQEGGRVQRLRPPHWPAYPPGAAYGRLYDRNRETGLAAARLGGRLIAADLLALGITVNCLPVADVPIPGADDVIGDRAYGDRPDKVAAVAAAIAEGLMEGAVLPVLKHLPGHGRATADSHKKLPVVNADRETLARSDFAAFKRLAHLPLGMTAHVVYTAFDAVEPATTSPTIIADVIRTHIGFAGALMTDDIVMGALTGSMAERARKARAAGCDLVLHCHGDVREKVSVARASGPLEGAAAARAERALAARRQPKDIDLAAARRSFAAMMQEHTSDARMTGS
jgi:beta-N-acetylhexosaminidase